MTTALAAERESWPCGMLPMASRNSSMEADSVDSVCKALDRFSSSLAEVADSGGEMTAALVMGRVSVTGGGDWRRLVFREGGCGLVE